MTAREADEVLVSDDTRGAGRVNITVVHGRYETALNVSAGELVRLRAAIDVHLSTPPADDVREALATLHRPVEIEPSSTICGECSWQLPNGRYFGKVAEYPCPTLDALAEVRPRGTVTPTPEEWAEQMDAERVRQIEHGYDDAHDAEHGAAHLLNWAIDYARRGNSIAAATMARCALRLPCGTVTDAGIEAQADAWDEGYKAGAEDQANVEGHRYTPENTSWMVVTSNPHRGTGVRS